MPTVLANSLRVSVRELEPHEILTLPEVAKKMDEIWPGWHRRVNPHNLDMTVSRYCVLGQIEGYSRGQETLFAHGVNYAGGMFLSNGFREAWIDEITARLAEDAPMSKPRRVLTAVSTLVLRCL